MSACSMCILAARICCTGTSPGTASGQAPWHYRQRQIAREHTSPSIPAQGTAQSQSPSQKVQGPKLVLLNRTVPSLAMQAVTEAQRIVPQRAAAATSLTATSLTSCVYLLEDFLLYERLYFPHHHLAVVVHENTWHFAARLSLYLALHARGVAV